MSTRARGILFALLFAETVGKIEEVTGASALAAMREIAKRVAANKEKYSEGRDTFVASELAKWDTLPIEERMVLSTFFAKHATRTDILEIVNATVDWMTGGGVDLDEPLSDVLAVLIGQDAAEKQLAKVPDDDEDDVSDDDDDDAE